MTEKEAIIWSFILGYISDNQMPPTRGEVYEALKDNPLVSLANRSGVQYYIERLVNKGYLLIDKTKKSRNIKVVIERK